MTWWDDDAGRYRSTLVHKLFCIWLWPVIRFVLHRCMTTEQAHWFTIHVGIRLVDAIDRVWGVVVLVGVIAWLLVIRVLLFLPGFTLTPPDETEGD